jgi:hypothetical protein
MDSKCVNILNQLSENYCNIDKRLSKINKRILKLQKEINIIDDLFLQQIAFVWATEDINFEKDKVKKILGFNIFETCAFEVPTYNDTKSLIQQLIDDGRKYIIVTNSSAVSAIIDLVYEYKDVQFITINSTDTTYSNISNLKRLEPDNSKIATAIASAFTEDYNIFLTEENQMKILGIYDSTDSFSKNLFEQINLVNSELLNITIKWFDSSVYRNGDAMQKEAWLEEWNDFLNELDYEFDLLYIDTDNSFLNDKITEFYLNNYLYKAYFSDAILGLDLDSYRIQPFGSILSKAFFTYIQTDFVNLYLLLVDSITSVRVKDFYQIQNVYYNKLINFNQDLNNIDNVFLYSSKNIFTTYTTTTQLEADYISFVNFLTDVNYRRFIRTEPEFQLTLVENTIKELNNYQTLTTNEKGNYNKLFIIPFNGIDYKYYFYGFNTLPNDTVYIPFNNLEEESILSFANKSSNTNNSNNTKNTKNLVLSSTTKNTNQNSDISIITNFLNSLNLNTNTISGFSQLDTNSYSFLTKTMFNTTLNKSLFFNADGSTNSQNVSIQLQQYLLNIGGTYPETVNTQYNQFNRVLQNMILFFKYYVKSNPFTWTLMYLPNTFLSNRINIRLLYKFIDDKNNIFSVGFENRLGTIPINSTITPSRIFNITNNSFFVNNTRNQNSQFNNVYATSDYYIYDNTTNTWNVNDNTNNQMNLLFDLTSLYNTIIRQNTFPAIKNIIRNNCKLLSVMISVSQRYLVLDSYIANQPKDFDFSNIPWDDVNNTEIFEDMGLNPPTYNFMIQPSSRPNIYNDSKFNLWKKNNAQFSTKLSSLINNSVIVSDNLVPNSVIAPQYTYQNTNKSQKINYIPKTNNVNSINIELFRKFFTTPVNNNFLYYLSQEPFANSQNVFTNNLIP